MKNNSSIKASLFWVMGGLTLGICLFFSAVSMLVIYMVEDEVLDRLLTQEAKYLQQTGLLQPRVDYMQLYFSSQQLPEFVQQALIEIPEQTEFFTPDQSHYHLKHVYVQDKHAYLLAEVGQLLAVTNMSRSIFFSLGSLLLLASLLAMLLAYVLSRRTSLPILQLAEQVQKMDEGRHEVRLQACEWQNELGYLARTLQKNIQQLQASLTRESHFTRDVSHELRTPLTIINNALALAEKQGDNPRYLLEVKQQTHMMGQIVESLLALARAESISNQPLDLNIQLEQSLLQLYSRMTESQFEVKLDLPATCKVQANSHLLHLLVMNVVENAMRYASRPELLIEAGDGFIRFSNCQDLPRSQNVTEPGIKAPHSQGLGQGLYLVERISLAMGWHMQVNNKPGLFYLHFSWHK